MTLTTNTSTQPEATSKVAERIRGALVANGTPLDEDDVRARLFIYSSALLSLPILILFAYLHYRDGAVLMLSLCIAWLPLLLLNFWVVRKGRSIRIPTRLTLGAGCLLILVLLFQEHQASSLMWCFVVPFTALFLFGRREGAIWTGAMLVAALASLTIYPSENLPLDSDFIRDFAIAYLFCSLFAYGYETLRAQARASVAEKTARLIVEQKRFQDFAEVASDWLFELDAELKFTFISENWARSMGVTAESLLGRPVTSIRTVLAEEDRERTSAVGIALMAHESIKDHRFTIVTAKGEIKVSCNLIPIIDGSNGFSGYRGTATDVTRFEENLALIRSKDAALVQSQKMEAIGQLTSGVAHDFNNLLTIINGNLEMLKLELVDAKINTTQVDAAANAAHRAAELTAKLLAFARRQPLEPGPVDLGALLGEMSDILNRTLGEHIAIEIEIQPELWLCRADSVQLESAILNLAINARDAMSDGGQLAITCRNHLANSHESPAGEYVELIVADTGTGISTEQIPHVFEPFYSTKPDGQGSGLGLSMVYGFVRQSGGHAQIDSEVDVGTTVRLMLPRFTDVMPVESSIDHQSSIDIGCQRILVVEDEADVLTLVSAMVRLLGHEVSVASNGERALDLIDTWQPDLIITDVILTGSMNGAELARQAQVLYPEIRILLMSGYPEYALRGDGSLESGLQLLKKPFGSKDLKKSIEDLYR